VHSMGLMLVSLSNTYRDRYGGWALLLAALFGLALSPWQPLTLVCLGAFAALAWRRLDRALCLLSLTFPYWFVPRPAVGHAVFPLSELALGACLAAALAREMPALWRPGRLERVRAGAIRLLRRLGLWLVVGTAALVLGLTLSLLAARMPREALRAWRWEALEPLLYLLLVVRYVRGRAAARWLIWSLLASALILALLAAVQVFWWHVTFTPIASGNRLVPYTSSGGGIPRATAVVFGSGNSLGAWMSRALPLALALLLAAAPLPRAERVLALVCLLAFVPALLWSDSRGALVAAVVACAAVLLLRGGSRRPLLLGTALLVVALIALWLTGALAASIAEHGGSAELRPLLWLAAWHMIQDHPLLGIGMDQFLYYYGSRYTDHPYWITVFDDRRTNVWREPDLSHPHNLPLELWLSGGPLALAGFALVLGNVWLRCLRLWRAGRGDKPEARWSAALALGVGASLLAGVVHGLVDSAYFAPDLALLFWWAVAVVLVLEVVEAKAIPASP
jgi:putative inorganic carbon (HCO3(-)) transporter